MSRTIAAVLALLLAVPPVPAAATAPSDEDARIIHVLNRLGYGPRPGDVERVRATGLDRWIDEQLAARPRPQPDLDRRLQALKTVGLSTEELLEGYEVPREARREIQKKRAEIAADGEPDPREVRQVRREMREKYGKDMAGPSRLVVDELQEAKLLRAVYSERQLEEVLVDFWTNHFNVFAGKGPVRFLAPGHERDVVRPHVFGKFEDMLLATAKSPAMLFYLDN